MNIHCDNCGQKQVTFFRDFIHELPDAQSIKDCCMKNKERKRILLAKL